MQLWIASDTWVVSTASLLFLSGRPQLLFPFGPAPTLPAVLTLLRLLALSTYRRADWRLTLSYVIHIFVLLQFFFDVYLGDLLPIISPLFVEVLRVSIILVCTLTSYLLPRVLPVFSLPEPTGPYQSVAFADLPMDSDVQHPTASTSNPNLYFRVFFPSSTDPLPADRRAFWANHPRTFEGFAWFSRFPSFIFSHLLESRIPAFRDQQLNIATPSASKKDMQHRFPIYLFSHGLGGSPECYATHAIEIASHGYIVVLPHHHDRSAAWMRDEHGSFQTYTRLTADQLKNDEYTIRRAQVLQRAAELKCAYDHLMKIKAFSKVADVSKGCLLGGHSFGGATACQLTLQEQLQVRGLIFADVWMLPLNAEQPAPLPSNIPSLDIQSDQWVQWTSHFESVKRMAPTSTVFLRGSRHGNFSDFAFLAPWLMRKLQVIGSAQPSDMMDEWHRLTLQFFRSL